MNCVKTYLFFIIVLAFIGTERNFYRAGSLCVMLHGNEPVDVLGFMC